MPHIYTGTRKDGHTFLQLQGTALISFIIEGTKTETLSVKDLFEGATGGEFKGAALILTTNPPGEDPLKATSEAEFHNALSPKDYQMALADLDRIERHLTKKDFRRAISEAKCLVSQLAVLVMQEVPLTEAVETETEPAGFEPSVIEAAGKNLLAFGNP